MTDKSTPQAGDDSGDTQTSLCSPGNLLKVVVGLVLFSIFQSCNNSFNGIVDWAKQPDMTTVGTVVQSIKPAVVLGTMRGIILASMTVIVITVGPPVWTVIGPVLGAAAKNSLRFTSGLSRATRSTGSFDPKDPLNERTDTKS